MLAYIKGTVLVQKPLYLLVLANNLGYKVYVPLAVVERYPTGSEVALYTYQYLRENITELYGFLQLADLDLFEQLITVSGIGPKAGLALLTTLTTDQIKQAISTNDVASLTRAPGIGKKTAERLVLELKGKFDILPTNLINRSNLQPSQQEVTSALTQLGYSAAEINDIVPHLDTTLSTEEQIKAALKLFGQHRHGR